MSIPATATSTHHHRRELEAELRERRDARFAGSDVHLVSAADRNVRTEASVDFPGGILADGEICNRCSRPANGVENLFFGAARIAIPEKLQLRLIGVGAVGLNVRMRVPDVSRQPLLLDFSLQSRREREIDVTI